MAYTTNALVKQQLRLSTSNDDDLIDDLIDVADLMIDQQTGIEWVASTQDKTFDAVRDVRNDNLDLITGYFTSISSVINGDGQSISSGNYEIVGFPNPYKICLHEQSGFRWSWAGSNTPRNAIAVSGDFGFQDTSPPAYIGQLSIEITMWLYRLPDNQRGSMIAVATGGGTIVQPASFPVEIDDRLKSLRKTFI